MNDLVSVIIVNWNGLRWLPGCFGSLAGQNWKKYEIIFVDNASRDGSVSWVRKHYPITKILINKENLGFSHANNIGYKKARGKYVLFLNNDTRVTKTFLTELVRALESSSDIGGAQSKILLMDHPDTHDSVGAFLTPTGFLYHFGFGKKDTGKYNKYMDLYTAKGACMMFRKSVLDTVAVDGNIFDPSYFAYFEETDLCHRVWLAGYRIVYDYTSVIFHKMGATSATMDNAFIQYHSFKNRINSYIKNLGILHLMAILPLHLLFCGLFVFACFLKGKISMVCAVHRAYWWNVTVLGKTLRKRYDIQHRIRKVPDAYFWDRIIKKPTLRYYWQVSSGKNEYEEIV